MFPPGNCWKNKSNPPGNSVAVNSFIAIKNQHDDFFERITYGLKLAIQRLYEQKQLIMRLLYLLSMVR